MFQHLYPHSLLSSLNWGHLKNSSPNIPLYFDGIVYLSMICREGVGVGSGTGVEDLLFSSYDIRYSCDSSCFVWL